MHTLPLSKSFEKRILNAFGIEGQIWLSNLPKLVTTYEKHFNLKVKKIFPHHSFNFTAQAVQNDGTEVVIKLCFPNNDVNNEITALTFMRGNGMVQLLDSDSKNGMLLLEKLNPGKMLTTISDDIEATRIAANVMQKLWKPIKIPHNIQTTKQWFTRLEQPITLPINFPSTILDRAKQLALELHQNTEEAVLLHGDLHHFNILSAERQSWLAIDPKGVVGEREYEVGALLRNPMPNITLKKNIKKILAQRVDLLAQLLHFDRKKISAWAFAQAVLAAIWCIDAKSTDWKSFLICSEVLLDLQ